MKKKNNKKVNEMNPKDQDFLINPKVCEEVKKNLIDGNLEGVIKHALAKFDKELIDLLMKKYPNEVNTVFIQNIIAKIPSYNSDKESKKTFVIWCKNNQIKPPIISNKPMSFKPGEITFCEASNNLAKALLSVDKKQKIFFKNALEKFGALINKLDTSYRVASCCKIASIFMICNLEINPQIFNSFIENSLALELHALVSGVYTSLTKFHLESADVIKAMKCAKAAYKLINQIKDPLEKSAILFNFAACLVSYNDDMALKLFKQASECNPQDEQTLQKISCLESRLKNNYTSIGLVSFKTEENSEYKNNEKELITLVSHLFEVNDEETIEEIKNFLAEKDNLCLKNSSDITIQYNLFIFADYIDNHKDVQLALNQITDLIGLKKEYIIRESIAGCVLMNALSICLSNAYNSENFELFNFVVNKMSNNKLFAKELQPMVDLSKFLIKLQNEKKLESTKKNQM